ncbi:DUF6705 family protein [Chryseobacterium binzhouense]|uniref:DUF6705 family protein n=1 Tax=Chryseobacterium binzhouense TaxID=2593646 RepID=UPI00117E91A7|nr:DUF6705 family protein [Chryseobacterium binzhouense]
MKNLIKLFTAVLLIASIACKSQTTASLLQMEECSNRPNRVTEGCPDLEDVKFVKDVDNRLNSYVGTWKGTFEGKQIELKLEKKIDFGNYDMKWDQLIGKIRIKDAQGNILYDSFQNADDNADPYGYNFQHTVYEMGFSGKSGCINGTIYLHTPTLSLNGGNKMKIFFYPNGDAIDTPTCPKLLPLTWADLTKQ